jgi:hypothetical protein
MDQDTKNELLKMSSQQLQQLHELVENLPHDYLEHEVENSLKNMQRGLMTDSTLEVTNVLANRHYAAGQLHVINEVREILGLPKLWAPGEKERHDHSVKMAQMGSKPFYDCPPLFHFDMIDGPAKLISLGEDGTLVVIGTKDRKRALRLMRKYEREYYGEATELEDVLLEKTKIVWRTAGDEDGDYSHMFSWSSRNTKNNPAAVDCFILEA